MSFYSLSKQERIEVVATIHKNMLDGLQSDSSVPWVNYFANEDTYIRKSAYLAVGRIYFANPNLQQLIIRKLNQLGTEPDPKIRQTAINAAGEIGKSHFEAISEFMDQGLFDPHHMVRNAVIGSIKKMGQTNPLPVLAWAKKYVHHPNKEIRREICHGIELRGRTHPEDILPILQELEHDPTARVRNTLIHVLGQIAYKKGCLEKVIANLNTWKNKKLVSAAVMEILDVHDRYKNFSSLTRDQAQTYISRHFIPS